MKDFDLTAVFCEILGGLAVLLMLIPLLDITGAYSLDDLTPLVARHLTSGTLVAVLVIAYLVGTVVDAVGLMFDDWWFGRALVANPPTDTERASFFKNVQEHILRYRDEQWTWYSCYRNLFLVFLPAGLFWVVSLGIRSHWGFAIALLVGLIVIEIALYRTMRVVLNIYAEITKAV